ncbi:hypothetical protein C8J56DRAFT_1057714 [Mycena floridula]|nr:hypothetical protein C8J56DRAFT_1057714 [Mycena floridula]
MTSFLAPTIQSHDDFLQELERLKACYAAVSEPLPAAMLDAAREGADRIYMLAELLSPTPPEQDLDTFFRERYPAYQPAMLLLSIAAASPSIPDLEPLPCDDSVSESNDEPVAVTVPSPARSGGKSLAAAPSGELPLAEVTARLQATLDNHVMKAYTCGHCNKYNAPESRKRWYVVVVGCEVGVFDDPVRQDLATKGLSGNKAFSFGRREQAEACYSEWFHSGRVALITQTTRIPVAPPAAVSPAAN